MSLILQPLRFLARALTDEDSDQQLALGFALGAVIGLVPKGNLTAALLMMLLTALRVNLAAGMLGIFAFSWLGMLTDPLTHRLGETLLTNQTLEPIWSALYALPLLPWTAFNNTVVLGSLLTGLLLFYPVYRGSQPLFIRYTPLVRDRLRSLRIVQQIERAEMAGKLGGIQ